MRFRLVPKSSTLDDPEWPLTAKTHSVAEKMSLLEPTAQIWMKIRPYYQRENCRPMILVSENIRFMRIFAGVPLGVWISKTTLGVVDDGYFLVIYDDMLPLVDRQMIAKWMTLNNLEWLFHVKMRFPHHFLNQSVWMSKNNTTSAILRCAVHCTIS